MRERFMVIMMIEMTGYIYDENDDMAPVMDAILQRIGMGVSYGKGWESATARMMTTNG